MSDAPKLYTGRDLVLAKRAGFVDGLRDAKMHRAASGLWGETAMELRANRRYPLPTVTRPRVIEDHTGIGPTLWRVVEGELEFRPMLGLHPWRRVSSDDSGMFVFSARVKLLADLLAQPTETVEADA